MNAETVLKDALTDAARALGAPADFIPRIERPRDPSFGDWSSNAAMTLARHLKRAPLEIAHELVARMSLADAGVREAYAAPPGFINFRLAAGAEARELARVLAAGEEYGRSDEGGRQAFNI